MPYELDATSPVAAPQMQVIGRASRPSSHPPSVRAAAARPAAPHMLPHYRPAAVRLNRNLHRLAGTSLRPSRWGQSGPTAGRTVAVDAREGARVLAVLTKQGGTMTSAMNVRVACAHECVSCMCTVGLSAE